MALSALYRGSQRQRTRPSRHPVRRLVDELDRAVTPHPPTSSASGPPCYGCGATRGRQETRVSSQRMHADEVVTDASLVRRLLAGQFPEWAGLPIEAVPSAGTDNVIYRLSDSLAVRLPRI